MDRGGFLVYCMRIFYRDGVWLDYDPKGGEREKGRWAKHYEAVSEQVNVDFAILAFLNRLESHTVVSHILWDKEATIVYYRV
jgi:hypothetical protein